MSCNGLYSCFEVQVKSLSIISEWNVDSTWNVCPAHSFSRIFMSRIFMSRIFLSYIFMSRIVMCHFSHSYLLFLVPHFHVSHFHATQYGAAFSCIVFSFLAFSASPLELALSDNRGGGVLLRPGVCKTAYYQKRYFSSK